jgi:hypothetical protein
MARATINTAGWTWSAVASGVIASLVVQVLLTMLGLGVGLVSFDATSSTALPAWLGFAWWAASGIFAAGVGGWVAGMLSPTANMRLKAIAGVTSWAVATLVVVGVTGVTAAGTGVTAFGPMCGPAAYMSRSFQTSSNAVVVRRETTGQASPMTDSARKQFATGMLISTFALMLGALTAFMGGWYSPNRDELELDE